MRVIAGQYRHRRLTAPPGEATRPILDRVKVALFDWLGARLAVPGQIPPVEVLDLFCGGGSLGIECLSRGATGCTFVEQRPDAVAVLYENLRSLRVGKEARIVQMSADVAQVGLADDTPYGLVFLDPPYALNDGLRSDSLLGRIVNRLGRDISLAADGLLVWRCGAHQVLPDALPGGLHRTETRIWGTLAISLYEKP